MTDEELIRQIQKEIAQEHQEPAIRFTLEPGEPGLCGSKTGGTPYLPHETPWPLDGEGQPMELLAQIDCAALQELQDFPKNGILQFFISLNETFGADFDDMTKPDNFRVLYHETADPSVTVEEVQAKRPVLPADVEEERRNVSPLNAVCRICFGSVTMQGLTEGSWPFDMLFCEKWNARRPDAPIENLWELSGDWDGWDDEEEEEFEDIHHQMGGYPYFTQTDPRDGGQYPELDVLLFQLDSDQDGRDLVLWGDCGVANFFISREDLKKRDFSKVGYNWDCC